MNNTYAALHTMHRIRRLRPPRDTRVRATLARLFPTIAAKFGAQEDTRAGLQRDSQKHAALQFSQNLGGLLQAGLSPAGAWHSLNVATDARGIPLAVSLERIIEKQFNRHNKKPTLQSSRMVAHTLRSCAEVSAVAGTSLTSMLNALQESIRNALEAEDSRKIAMAGPKASALILQALPVIGIGCSFLLGINPFEWFATTVAGAICVSAGVALLLLGRKWSNQMIARATSPTRH